MELKLVYRALRKVSDWTISDYYSEVSIQGKENVPKGGPLIMSVPSIAVRPALADSYHPLALLPTTMKSLTLLRWVSLLGNGIVWIDPTPRLAATMPYRRHLSFWAKSTMFANPVAGAVLTSTGAIPVRRNPNSSSTATLQSSSGPSTSKLPSPPPTNDSSSRAALFRETSKALADQQVVGVFPEGTSYTRESIAQFMPGAAWAAVEYARFMSHDQGGRPTDVIGKGKGKDKETNPGLHTGLKIVPVSIVYTDKSRYQSRVSATCLVSCSDHDLICL